MGDNLNIYQKMSKITEEIGVVAKNLNVQTSKSASYKAVSERDVIDCVKPIEAKHGIFSYPSARKVLESHVLESESEYQGKVTKKTTFMTRMETTYRFVNVDNPLEFVETTVFSEGIDSQDKGSGKAMTYADKYALMKQYKISTGDDPDETPSINSGYTKNTVVKCPNCGKEIKGVKKNGKDVYPEEILESCGGVCVDCYKKAKAAQKAAQTENKDFEVIE